MSTETLKVGTRVARVRDRKVYTITQVDRTSAGSTYTLLSKHGGRLAVSATALSSANGWEVYA